MLVKEGKETEIPFLTIQVAQSFLTDIQVHTSAPAKIGCPADQGWVPIFRETYQVKSFVDELPS